MINTKKIVLIVVSIVALLAVGIIAIDGQSKNTESSKNRAPDFTLFDTNGDTISLSDYEGKVVILNFWATWCRPCLEEIPGFIKLQEKYIDDVVILGISVDEDGPSVVPRFLERLGINYTILYANGETIRDYGSIQYIPTTFVLDRNLDIHRFYFGYRPIYVFEQDIKSLIQL